MAIQQRYKVHQGYWRTLESQALGWNQDFIGNKVYGDMIKFFESKIAFVQDVFLQSRWFFDSSPTGVLYA
jgi:hypothetical protein